jgi:hypothetical protein
MADKEYLEEALNYADSLAQAGHWGGESGFVRVLAERVRELEAADTKDKKKKK